MDGSVQDAGNGASKSTFGNGSEKTITPASGSDPDEWLYEAAQVLLGKDAGLHLHYLTGYPPTSCYAYVAKNRAKRRRQPDHFTRKLIHSPQGEPFFRAFMAGCDAPWWIELQHAASVGRKVLDITK